MASTVLITGASQGIGKATSLLFARKGYNLVLAARQPDRLEAVASEVREAQLSRRESLGRAALAVPTDVTNPEQVNALVQKALAHYGSIDVLCTPLLESLFLLCHSQRRIKKEFSR